LKGLPHGSGITKNRLMDMDMHAKKHKREGIFRSDPLSIKKKFNIIFLNYVAAQTCLDVTYSVNFGTAAKG
jgi:hypothetical protein